MRLQSAIASLAWLGFTVTAAAAPTPQITLLSNPADPISGGDALVQVDLHTR